ncbi:MAG: helix-turn-helix transcriptional regulator [Synergistaceae bacterium]|nr:helix-turn-helix transcriptional regulator [Synergistaceae bacterium]
MGMMIGEKIKELREQKGLTQGELAALIGNDGNTISRWERNKIGVGNKYIVKLAQALDTPVAYLMDLETDASEHRKPVDKVEPVQGEINFEPVDKVDTARKTSVDKGTLRYKFSNGQEIDVPNTPENAAMFWEIVKSVIGLPAAAV